jgi:membrane-associated phospholipid phosphatase
MKLRIKPLLFTLLLPMLAASVGFSPAHAGNPRPPAGYPSQPNSHEPPRRYPAPPGVNATARLAYWSEQAWRTIAIDHTPPPAGPSDDAEQSGPTRSSRVMAIFHIAIYDALNAIYRRYPGYSGNLAAFADSSPDAAIAQAAHDALAALYPLQANRLHAVLNADLARLPAGRAKLNGIDIGHRAAAAILALRANDGSDVPEPIVGVDYPLYLEPGKWRPDPVSGIRLAFGAYWRQVKPFVLPSVTAFVPPPPPALTSDAYTQAFNEVKQLGGNGTTTPTKRTWEQTRIGIYWGYDSTAWLGTPIVMYNQIGVQVIRSRTTDPLEEARAIALLNVALADGVIAGWRAKYYYRFWRPVHGIREASPGTGPTGRGDGNPDTHADPNWTPLGAPASNLVGPDFTPPFPAYPSGHAVTGGVTFETLRNLYGDSVPFTFLSDEWNGVTRDNDGWVRPRWPRSYSSFSQAEQEAGQSRIYLGVHWYFDKTAGLAVGHQVADYVFQHGLVRPDQ